MKKMMLMAAALIVSATMFASTGHKTTVKVHRKKQATTAQTVKEKPAPKEEKTKMKGKHKGTKPEAAKEKPAPKSEVK